MSAISLWIYFSGSFSSNPSATTSAVSAVSTNFENDENPIMYKWQDREGRWVYSNQTPPESVEYSIVGREEGRPSVVFKDNPLGLDPKRKVKEKLDQGFSALLGKITNASDKEDVPEKAAVNAEPFAELADNTVDDGFQLEYASEIQHISGESDEASMLAKLKKWNELLSIETINRDLAEKNQKIREKSVQNFPEDYRKEYLELMRQMEERNASLGQ